MEDDERRMTERAAARRRLRPGDEDPERPGTFLGAPRTKRPTTDVRRLVEALRKE